MPAKYQSINRIEKNKLIIKANNSENNSELLFWIKVRVTESDPIGDDIIYVKNIPWPFDIEAKLYKRRKLTNNVKFNKVFYNSSEKKLTIRFETSGEKNKGREKHAHFLKKFRKLKMTDDNQNKKGIQRYRTIIRNAAFTDIKDYIEENYTNFDSFEIVGGFVEKGTWKPNSSLKNDEDKSKGDLISTFVSELEYGYSNVPTEVKSKTTEEKKEIFKKAGLKKKAKPNILAPGSSFGIKPKIKPLSNTDQCEPTKLSDPDGQKSEFFDLYVEVCEPISDEEDVLPNYPDDVFIKSCPTCVPNLSATPLNWWDKENLPRDRGETTKGFRYGQVWLNEKTCEYKIVLRETEGGSLGDFSDYRNGNRQEVVKRMSAARRTGIQLILEETGKAVSDNIICANLPTDLTAECINIPADVEVETNRLELQFPPQIQVIKQNVDTDQNDGTYMTLYGVTSSIEYQQYLLNPKALEIYSKCEIYPYKPGTAQYMKQVRPCYVVSAPANLINMQSDDLVSEANEKLEELETNPEIVEQDGVNTITIRGTDLRSVYKQDIPNMFEVFAEYQANFLYFQNGKLRIETLDGGSKSFYLFRYPQKFKQFYVDLKSLLEKNGYRLRLKDDGFKHAYEIKIKVNDKFEITNVKAKYIGCPWRTCRKGIKSFKNKYANEKTLIAYIIRSETMLANVGNELPPWLDYLVEYTYPNILVSYGNTDRAVDFQSCLNGSNNNPNDPQDIQLDQFLEDFLLSLVSSFSGALQYSLNTLNCRTIDQYDPMEYVNLFEPGILSQNPQVVKTIADYKAFGQALTDARKGTSKKAKETYKKLMKGAGTFEFNFFERLVGKSVGDYVKEFKGDAAGAIGELFTKMRPCDWEKILLDLLRCLMKGLNANTALKKIAKALMGDLRPVDFARVFKGLPPEVQLEVQADIVSALKQIPWFNEQYDEFNIDDFVNLSNKKKKANANAYEEERDKLENPPETQQTDPSNADRIKEQRDNNKKKEEDIENLQQSYEEQLEFEKFYYDRVRGLNVLYERVTSLKEQTNEPGADLEELNNQIAVTNANISEYEINIAAVIEGVFLESDPDKGLISDTILQEVEKLKQEKNSSNLALLDELTKNYDPNVYEKATREIVTIIGEAYIDLIVEKLNIVELQKLVDSLPGSDIFVNVFKAALCPHKEIFQIWSKAAWASLDVNPCKKTSWRLPPIPEIPKLNFLYLLNILKEKFLIALVKAIVAVLVSYFMKSLQLLLDKLCDLLSGATGALFNDSGQGNLFDAVTAAFCDDLDANNNSGGLPQNGSGVNSVIDALKQNANYCPPNREVNREVVYQWGLAISEKIPLEFWQKLMTEGGISAEDPLMQLVWEITLEFPEMACYFQDISDLFNFFNILKSYLPEGTAIQIEEGLGALEYTSNGNELCKMFCSDFNYGIDDDLPDYPLDTDPDELSQTFEDLLDAFYGGPDSAIEDLLKDIADDPYSAAAYCDDIRNANDISDESLSGKQPLVGPEPEELTELRNEIVDSVFSNLEVAYYNDLIVDFDSFFNNILSDKDNKKLTKGELFDPSHEFREKTNLLFPNSANNAKEHGIMWYRGGFLKKLFMRINTVLGDPTSGEDASAELDLEEVEAEAEAIDEAEDGILRKALEKAQELIQNAVSFVTDKIGLNGPIKKLFAVFKLDFPIARNLFPTTVGINYLESLSDNKPKYVLTKLPYDKTELWYGFDLEDEIGLKSSDSVEVSDREYLQKDDDLYIYYDSPDGYRVETGFSSNYIPDVENPNYHVSCYIEYDQSATPPGDSGLTDEDELGNTVALFVDFVGNNNSSKIRESLFAASVAIDVSYYQETYDKFVDGYAQNSLNSHFNLSGFFTKREQLQSYAFKKYIMYKMHEEGGISTTNFKFPTIHLDSDSQYATLYNSNSDLKFNNDYSSLLFYDRVAQDAIAVFMKTILKSGTRRIGDTIQAPNCFKFGYSSKHRITGADITYVSPDLAGLDKQNKWDYPHENEEKILGVSATKNDRVVFLNPEIYGGSYKRPKIYIKPPDYKGVLGIMNYFVPEPDACEPSNEIKLFTSDIKKEILEMEKKLTRDKRLNYDPNCVKESAFDLIADSSSHAYLHGSVKLTIRTYVLELFLRTIPILFQISLSEKNFDDVLNSFIFKRMKAGLFETPENFSFRKYSKLKYWYLFLEQMVQAVEREVLLGSIYKDENLDDLFKQIRDIRKDYYEPDRNDWKILKKIKKIKLVEANPKGSSSEYKEFANGKNYKLSSLKDYDIRFEFKSGVNYNDFGSKYKSLLKKMVKSIIFVGLGDDGERYMQSTGDYQKFSVWTLGYKEFKNVFRIYSIYLNEQLAENISYYLIGQEIKSYTSRFKKDLASGKFEPPQILDIKKYALNPESGLAIGPDILVGTRDGELTPTSPEGYGDVNDYTTFGEGESIRINNSNNYSYDTQQQINKFLNKQSDDTHSFFLLQKYVLITSVKEQQQGTPERIIYDSFKPYEGKRMSIKKFKEKVLNVISSGISFSSTSSISDYFGDADLDGSEKGYSGSIGIKFGVRMAYVRNDLPTSGFQSESELGNFKSINVIASSSVFGDVNGSIRPIELLNYEADLADFPMQEFMYERCSKNNIQEDIKCYIDRMCEKEEFAFLMDFCFPFKRVISLLLINAYYGYVESIGKGEGERYPGAEEPSHDWKYKILQQTKDKLRTMFSRYYKARNPTDNEKGKRSKSWIKANIPDININLDRLSIKWWQLMRRHDRPFNKYDEACIDGALGSFNQNLPPAPVSPDSNETGVSASGLTFSGGITAFKTSTPEPCDLGEVENENLGQLIAAEKSLEKAGVIKASNKKPLFSRDKRNKIVRKMNKSSSNMNRKIKETPVNAAPTIAEKITISTSVGKREKMKNDKTKKIGNPKNFTKKR